MDFLNMNTLWIASSAFAILMVILAVVGMIAVIVGRYRPTLAQAAAAEETLLVRRQELADIEEKTRNEQARYAEAEKKATEVAWLEERLSNLNAEINTLEPRRAEILEVQQRLESITAEYGDMARETTQGKHELERLEAEIEHGRRQQAECEAMERRITELRDELRDLQSERDEAVHAHRQLAELKETLEVVGAEITRKETTLETLRERENETQERLRGTVEELSNREQKLEALKDELAELRQEKISLTDVTLEVEALQDRRARLEAHNAELERRIKEMGGESSGSAKADTLEDLKEMPSALEPLLTASFATSSNEERTEGAYLRRAEGVIEEAGLRYHGRTIRAFHTALKIAQEAPMTVLSGISGTGKTQLPRYYAEGMGIGFLPLPVQPRWDSPQDLLGFYNFIEKKYKATELARALWQLNGLGEMAYKDMLEDRMLLVLLDEMNLSRVEYYFSEFLSRLEMRPSPEEASDRDNRRNAEILIEVPGQAPIHLFPGHNLLFTGTMNEDESTQALSDKVLDRGNMLRFPAPKEFYNAHSNASRTTKIAPISRSVWASWRKDISSLPDINDARAMVSDLADLMKELKRPFGHRVGQAMLAYSANYPSHDGQHGTVVLNALCDQVEMRLLPKLRGLELDTARDGIGKLAEHVKEKLLDDALAEAIDESVTASQDTGRFAWRGLTR